MVNGANGVNADRSPKERAYSAARAKGCHIVAGRIEDVGTQNVF